MSDKFLNLSTLKVEQPFKNVALLPEDHAMLKKIADADQRTMTRQLSVIIRNEFDKWSLEK
tara:strand:+ start:1734 stop:1916 length:183 start_codon:yes stop_codon:yes gene_type:complete